MSLMRRRGMTADELLERFQRMVRKQDYWRGYVGDDDDSPSDDDVEELLQDARFALELRETGTRCESQTAIWDGEAEPQCERGSGHRGKHWNASTLDSVLEW